MRLLNVERAAVDILHEPRASGREHARVGDTEPAHDAITYLTNHKARMNYAAVRAAGLPIGSGGVEATCKTISNVQDPRPDQDEVSLIHSRGRVGYVAVTSSAGACDGAPVGSGILPQAAA